MLKFGEDVEVELRTQVIQACEVKPGVYGKLEVCVGYNINNNFIFDNCPYM